MINFKINIIICNVIFFHLRTFVKLWELVDLRAFSPRPALPRPAPWIFTFAPPRGFSSSPCPAGKSSAPPRPSLIISTADFRPTTGVYFVTNQLGFCNVTEIFREWRWTKLKKNQITFSRRILTTPPTLPPTPIPIYIYY